MSRIYLHCHPIWKPIFRYCQTKFITQIKIKNNWFYRLRTIVKHDALAHYYFDRRKSIKEYVPLCWTTDGAKINYSQGLERLFYNISMISMHKHKHKPTFHIHMFHTYLSNISDRFVTHYRVSTCVYKHDFCNIITHFCFSSYLDALNTKQHV